MQCDGRPRSRLADNFRAASQSGEPLPQMDEAIGKLRDRLQVKAAAIVKIGRAHV